MEGGSLARAGPLELRLPRPAADPRLGDRARARRDAAAVPRGRRRPVRPLPPAADPHRAGAPQLPQPARLLGLGRRVFLLFGAIGFWGSGGGHAPPLTPSRWPGRRAARARPARRGRLARRAQPPPAAPADPPGGAARGPQRRAARARRRRPARRRDESVRAHLRPPVAPRLALAAAGTDAATRRCARRLPRRPRSARLPRLDVRHPLRARLGRAVVHRPALRGRLRAAARCS